MKIECGIIKSKIYTDNPDLLKALIRLYTFKVPGSEFSTAYKRRRWDGKKRFITAAGNFPSGLLSYILADLKRIDCAPDVEVLYKEGSPLSVKNIKNFTYYNFQKDFVKKALLKKRGVIKSPTGSGKTLIMAGIIKALSSKKMVILFNAKQILTQTYDFLNESCGIENLGICFGEGYIYGDIMLCTVQSIDKILDTHLEEAEVLLVDEVHEFANGKVTLAAINSFPKAQYRVGFTATPPSDAIPKYNLAGAFGPLWEETSTSSLIEEGKLTKPLIQLIPIPSLSSLNESSSYLEVYENFIVKNQIRNQKICDIVTTIKETNKKARLLILVNNLEHAQQLHTLIKNSFKLWGEDPILTRYQTISKFISDKKSSVLIGTKILQTGINIEEITHFINARGLKSEIATIQALGRALRTHDSMNRVYIYDFIDNAKYLREHSRLRKEYYLSEGHEIKIL